jgi:Zn-dependent protease with chaperone function
MPEPIQRFRNAGRPKQWQPIPASSNTVHVWHWLLQVFAVLTSFWLVLLPVQSLAVWTSVTLSTLTWIEPFRQIYSALQGAQQVLPAALIGAFGLSPWLLDAVILWFYDLDTLTLEQLNQFSPEAGRILSRLFRHHRLPLPKLRLLSVGYPIIFSYGFLPAQARLVISRGLLQQLEEDEIAAIALREASPIVQTRAVGWWVAVAAFAIGLVLSWFRQFFWAQGCWWISLIGLMMGLDLACRSWIVLLLQISYGFYRHWAQWADETKFPFFSWVLTALANLSYGLFRGLWFLGLPIVKLTQPRSDRFAVNATGNPNGLARALLKMALGISQSVKQQSSLPPLLASVDLLLPLDPQAALYLGGQGSQVSLATRLHWDYQSPYRIGLSLFRPHPPLGDRLQKLMQMAVRWGVEPELDLVPVADSGTWAKHLLLMWQWAAPLGAFLGFLGGGIFWVLGELGDRFTIGWLLWLLETGDRWAIWIGLMFVGFSLGMIVRINRLFPIPKLQTPAPTADLVSLGSTLEALPLQGVFVQLQGQLLNSRSSQNTLGQQLFLQTETGLIKLIYTSALGPVGNFLLPQQPNRWGQTQATIQGWFRRGAVPWLEIHTLRTQSNRLYRANAPLWTTGIALLTAAIGVFLIWRGDGR